LTNFGKLALIQHAGILKWIRFSQFPFKNIQWQYFLCFTDQMSFLSPAHRQEMHLMVQACNRVWMLLTAKTKLAETAGVKDSDNKLVCPTLTPTAVYQFTQLLTYIL